MRPTPPYLINLIFREPQPKRESCHTSKTSLVSLELANWDAKHRGYFPKETLEISWHLLLTTNTLPDISISLLQKACINKPHILEDIS